MKFTYIMDISFKKLKLFLYKLPFLINTLFPPLREGL
jgi:hypothetical protein